MLQIGKIQQAPAALFGSIGGGEVLHQGEQPPHRRPYQGHVGQQVGAGILEQLPELSHPFFAFLSDGLDLLLGHGIAAAPHRPQLGERDLRQCRRPVPPRLRRRDKGPQALHRGGQAGGVAPLQLLVPRAQLPGVGHPALPVPPLPGGVGQQQPAPHRLPRVRRPGQVEGGKLFPQPGGGVGVGLDLAVDVQSDLHQPAVVPPGGQGVHQQCEIRVLPDGLIPPFQQVVHGPESQHPRLPLVAEAEVRLQVQQVAALPQELGAEGVDGGNLGLVDQGGLPPQMAVAGLFRQPGGQLVHDAPAQLGGGGLGVGDDQKAVDVQPLVLHPGQEPLHQHPGLAGTGGSGHQQAAAPVGHHGALLRGQGKGHV